MSCKNTSRTAFGTAYLLIAHQLLDAAPHILEDPVIAALIGQDKLKRVTDDAEHNGSPGQRALRAHVVLRSRYAEDRLAAALPRGIQQYVILGAGPDTFSLRQPSWAKSLAVFEVDHRGTQDMKRGLIAAAGLTVPGNVHLATIDFDGESLFDGLKRNAVCPETPTFFSWLGVTMYLNQGVVAGVIRSVAAFPAGSEIVLSFARKSDVSSRLALRTASLGEAWISHFEPQDIETMLRDAGFTRIAFLSSAEAEAAYFRSRPRDLPVPSSPNVVAAIR